MPIEGISNIEPTSTISVVDNEEEVKSETDAKTQQISYVHLIRKVCQDAKMQGPKSNMEKHRSTTEITKNIRVSSKNAAGIQETNAKWSLAAGAISGLCALTLFSNERPPVQNLFKMMGEQGSNMITSVANNYYGGRAGIENNLVQLNQTRLSNQINNRQDTAMQGVDQLSQEATGIFANAARGG